MSDELAEIPFSRSTWCCSRDGAAAAHLRAALPRDDARCLDTGAPIGVVLALPEGAVAHEVPAHIGTMARICDYQRLPDGRYNLLTIGMQRFEVVEVRYLTLLSGAGAPAWPGE